jgi:rhodanese-related sulfurtransferase
VARLLIDRGFTLVRPLAGGLDAWVARGFDTETYDLVAHRDAGA